MSSLAAEAESAKREVAACEKEIGAIKASLRVLGPAEGSDDTATNSLIVAWTKVRTEPNEPHTLGPGVRVEARQNDGFTHSHTIFTFTYCSAPYCRSKAYPTPLNPVSSCNCLHRLKKSN
jgi:hypothetical protein